MKLRIMGTRDECDLMVEIFERNIPREFVRSISGFYPNRGYTTEGRVYIDLDLPVRGQEALDGTMRLKEWRI